MVPPKNQKCSLFVHYTNYRSRLSEAENKNLTKKYTDFIVEYTKEKEDFTEYRFSVQTEPDYYVPCHLLVPKINTDKIFKFF